MRRSLTSRPLKLAMNSRLRFENPNGVGGGMASHRRTYPFGHGRPGHAGAARFSQGTTLAGHRLDTSARRAVSAQGSGCQRVTGRSTSPPWPASPRS